MDIRNLILRKTVHGTVVTRSIGVLLLMLAAALTLWLLVCAHYRRDAIEGIAKSLETANSYKISQIEDWVRLHDREAVRLSEHPFLGKIIAEEISHPGSQRAQLRAWLLGHTVQKRYFAMAILSPKGTVIAASPGYVAGTEPRFKTAFAQATKKRTALLTDIYLTADGRQRITMFSPISDKGLTGAPLCVLVTKIDPNTELYPLVKAAPLLFTKAETLLVRKEGENVLFLNELDFVKGSALKLTHPLSDDILPAAAALTGRSGFFAGTDYRGKKVFSALGRVKDPTWGVITKVDQGAVLGPVKAKESLILALILLATILLYGGFYAVLILRERAAQEAIKGAETALHVSEQIFREFMEHSPIYVFFKDENIRAVRLSRNYEKMIGKPLEELLGKSMDELFPSELAKSMVADDIRILKEGKDVVIEEEFNGRNYRTIKFPIAIEGKPRYLAGYTLDITESKRAEEELRRINERLALSARAAHLGVWDWNIPKNELVWDDRMYELYGVKREDFSGAYETWLKGVHPDDRAFSDELSKQAQRGEREYDTEFRVIWPDGSIHYLKAYGQIVRDAAGRPLRMTGVNFDITESKLAEESIRKSEEKYRTIFEESFDGLFVTSPDGKILDMNKKGVSMFGYDTKEEVLKLDLTRDIYASPPDRARILSMVNAQGTAEYEILVKKKNGAPMLAHCALTAVKDSGDTITSYRGIIRDITESKRTEEALCKSSEDLKEAQRLARIGSWEWDATTDIITWSEEYYSIYGLDPSQRPPGYEEHLKAYTAESAARLDAAVKKNMRTGEPYELDLELAGKGETRRWITARSETLRDAQGKVTGLRGTAQDITERKRIEEERLAHLRFFENMNSIDQAIRGETDPERMMNNVLNAALKIFNSDRAWLFYPCDPDAPTFRVPMEVTKPEYPGAKTLNEDLPMAPDMARNLREALRSAAPVTYTAGTEKPINKVTAERFGVRSQIMTAIYPKQGKPWVFGMHQCSSARVWTPEEIGLMQEIGRRLADSMTSLLSRRDLQENELKLKDAQRLAHIGNWTLDLVSNKLSWSDEIYRIFELDPARFGASYEAFLAAIHPDDREAVDKAYTDSVKDRSGYAITHRLLMADGRIKYVEERCQTAYAPDGRPLTSIGTVQDITAQKLAEKELRGTEERLRSLMNSMPDIVCFKDEAGRWLEANAFDLKLFQLENVEYKGKKDSELAQFSAFYHDAFMTCEASDEEAWRAGAVTRAEEVIPLPDGSKSVFDIIKVPLFTPEGKRKALTVVGRDITKRKLAELEKERLNAALLEKNQEMENFLYITTHDLRSPLVNIQGFSQNLERYIKELRAALEPAALPAGAREALESLTGDRIPEALKFVLESSRKMDALITALLKVSRIGRVEMKPETLEMNGLLTKILDTLRYQLEEAGAKVEAGNLPPCSADPGAASQLFTNLLDNAIKYRHKDRPLLVNVTGEVNGDRVVYTVADNGDGIPAAEMDKIWNVFYQQDRSPGRKGEGIGLPMVKRIAEKNGGSIWAESKEGRGTVFYVELPAAGREKK